MLPPRWPRASRGSSHGLPDFSLADTTGQLLELSELTGKNVVYLDFWATWCGPCGVEMPHLQRLYETYKAQGLVVLGVAMDDPSTQGSVAAYVHRSGLSFPVVIDQDSRATNPTTRPAALLTASDRPERKDRRRARRLLPGR